MRRGGGGYIGFFWGNGREVYTWEEIGGEGCV